MGRTSRTEQLLTDFIVREILCKPMTLTVVKHEPRLTTILDQPEPATIEGSVEPILFPPETSGESND